MKTLEMWDNLQPWPPRKMPCAVKTKTKSRLLEQVVLDSLTYIVTVTMSNATVCNTTLGLRLIITAQLTGTSWSAGIVMTLLASSTNPKG